jgi:outer membrane lipoprotein-sorting protein
VSVNPPVDTEVALLTPLEVTFDQPMNPAPYGLELSTGDPEPFVPDRKPKIQGRVDYEERTHRFTLLMKLPAHWNGELRLEGFRGASGVSAGPVTLKYRTLRQPLSPALQQKIDQAGQQPSPELRRLVESVQHARRDAKSVSEQVLTTMSFGSGSDWHQRYDLQGSRFRMQGARKFVGNRDAIMRIPFRVGSDGTTCWLVRSNELIEIPFDQIDQNDLLFCDLFDATGGTGVDRLIRDRKLQYVGETVVRGRRCHLIRSNEIHLVTTGMLTPMIQWSIDAETFLPARVEMDDTLAMDYVDVRINEAISDEEFRPQVGPEVRKAEQQPLDEGYTRRFLKVNDGTGGRMSVRWGMTGPKGRSSSGLN